MKNFFLRTRIELPRLANANKRKHIRVINGRLGLLTPGLITPLELFSEEEYP